MKHKDFMIRILLLLVIFYVSAPTTRSLAKDSKKMEKALFQEYPMRTNEVKVGDEKFEILEQGFFEGRMDFEKTDYSGVGANPEHDPKPPAKV